MNTELLHLKAGLVRALQLDSRGFVPANTANAMAKMRAKIEKELGSASMDLDSETIAEVVSHFRHTQKTERFRDLKYVCAGIGSILGEALLVTKVLLAVDSQSSLSKKIRCFQALLGAYFRFAWMDLDDTNPEKSGRETLRQWLQNQYAQIASTLPSQHHYVWMNALQRHENLLTVTPCTRYGEGLLRDDPRDLNDAIEGLSIPRDSWVMEEVIIAHIQAATRLPDTVFQEKLPSFLAIATRKKLDKMSSCLQKRCMSFLVSRYVQCAHHPEHAALRDAAVSIIGNPWINRRDWELWVHQNNQPDEAARSMVFGWLKSRLMTDFFELLSEDGTNDPRRLDYWLGFSDAVEDMWFVLGRNAQNNRSEPFKDFRQRAKGRLLNLAGATPENNAFVMRIGNYVLVEFGAAGQGAFYLLDYQSVEHLFHYINNSIDIKLLKPQNKNKLRIAHQGDWELNFNKRLREFGISPTKEDSKKNAIVKIPHSVVSQYQQEAPLDELLQECRKSGILVIDNRSRGSALWVEHDSQNDSMAKKLHDHGFTYTYKHGRGWYKE